MLSNFYNRSFGASFVLVGMDVGQGDVIPFEKLKILEKLLIRELEDMLRLI